MVSDTASYYLIADERGGLSREQPLVTAATPLLIAAALLLISVFFFWNLLQRTSFPPLLRAAQAIVAAFVIPTMLPTIMVFGITGAVIFGNLHLDLLCHGRASDGAQTAQTSRNLSTFHPVSNMLPVGCVARKIASTRCTAPSSPSA